MKQSSLDDHETLGMELALANDNGEEMGDLGEYDERQPADDTENNQIYSTYKRRSTPPPTISPLPVAPIGEIYLTDL